MKKLRSCLIVLASVLLLVTFGAGSSHAIIMKITDGTFTSASGESRPITGTVDWTNYSGGGSSLHTLGAANADVYIDGLDPIHTDYYTAEGHHLWLEYRLVFEDNATFITYLEYGSPDSDGFAVYTEGTVFYESDSYSIQGGFGSAYGVTFESLQMDITLGYWDLSTDQLLYQEEINLTAAAPVPEPATLLLLACGLLGLAGFRRKFRKK